MTARGFFYARVKGAHQRRLDPGQGADQGCIIQIIHGDAMRG